MFGPGDNGEVEACLEAEMRRLFPAGHRSDAPAKVEARVMFETAIHAIKCACDLRRTKWRVDLEYDTARRNILGLVIQIAETTIIPVTVSHNVIRIRNRPTYTDFSNGAVNVLNAVLDEVSDALAADAKAAAIRSKLGIKTI